MRTRRVSLHRLLAPRRRKSRENQVIFHREKACGENVAKDGRLPHGGSSHKVQLKVSTAHDYTQDFGRSRSE
jgi:hypothetical protein